MKKSRVSYEVRLAQAVKAFWLGRDKAAEKQLATGRVDSGNRSKATGGKALDSFRDMIVDVVLRSANTAVDVHRKRALVGLPGHFRPTKLWDLVILHEGRLLAALELKSLCGPSFSNNANNRCEEALGSAYDFRKAQSEGLFGAGASPFLGYFILVEDAEGSRKPVKESSPHFPADKVFRNASYQQRMRLMCERMVQHQLYAFASVMVAVGGNALGESRDLCPHTSFRSLLTRLGAHLASEPLTTRENMLLEEPSAADARLTFDGEYFESTESG